MRRHPCSRFLALMPLAVRTSWCTEPYYVALAPSLSFAGLIVLFTLPCGTHCYVATTESLYHCAIHSAIVAPLRRRLTVELRDGCYLGLDVTASQPDVTHGWGDTDFA
ncbi:hypothetical protein EI94DRAFT_1732879 [Lactarius quietus]|nr:hypothetical protein EI94DRAFT_1732879 [Lactarius quietus]